MTLDEFLRLCSDEELRVEILIDEEGKDDYLYQHFWLSDYRCGIGINKHYSSYKVKSYSTIPLEENSSEISISIEK